MDILATSGPRHLLGRPPARHGLLIDLEEESAREILVQCQLARGYWGAPPVDPGERERVLEIARAAALCFQEERSARKALRETSAKLKSEQRRWASENMSGTPDNDGYMADWRLNILDPHDKAEQQFNEGDGHELHDGRRPAKMRATHSSSALAWNFFGIFQRIGCTPLESAFQAPFNFSTLAFERRIPSVVGGGDHNLDVVLSGPDAVHGGLLAIESKFCEPYDGPKKALREAYFPADGRGGPWARYGAPLADDLADRLRAGCLRFVALDAAQLLKHALGLLANFPDRPWQLLYLYYEADGRSGEIHATEVRRFQEFLACPHWLRAMSYQELFGALPATGDAEYLRWRRYVGSRYHLGARSLS